MGRKGFSEEELISILQEAAKEVDGILSIKVFNNLPKKPGASVSTFKKFFGSWNAALEAAGLPANDSPATYTKDEVIATMREVAANHGGYLSVPLYKLSKKEPDARNIIRMFGTWKEALKVAGIQGDERNEYTKEQLIARLQEYTFKYPNSISQRHYNKHWSPASRVLINHFQSWNKALLAAGITPKNVAKKQYTKKEVIEALQDFYCQNGNYISNDLYVSSKKTPSLVVIRRMFGSWNEALIAAGIPINVKYEKVYTKKDCLDALLKASQKHSKLTRELYKQEKDGPSISTIEALFVSWQQAVREANINGTIKNYEEQEVLDSLRKFAKEYPDKATMEQYLAVKWRPTLEVIRRNFGSWTSAVKIVLEDAIYKVE